MKLYAYAIIDSNSGVEEPLIGLDGVSVYTIPYRGIGIVVSDLEAGFQVKTKESVLKHEEVVEALMDKFTVLPMRLYTVFSGKEELLLKTKDYYGDFIKNLDRVHNKREFGVKVIWDGNVIKKRIVSAHKPKGNGLASDSQSHKNGPFDFAQGHPEQATNDPSTKAQDSSRAKSRDEVRSASKDGSASAEGAQAGTKFMKEKFEKYKIDKEFEEEADRCIAIVDGFLNRLASEKKLEKLKTENLLLSAAYLVDKEKSGDFKKAFGELKGSGGDLKYMLSGPWPAYNFITLKHSGDGKFDGPDLIETMLKHKDAIDVDEEQL